MMIKYHHIQEMLSHWTDLPKDSILHTSKKGQSQNGFLWCQGESRLKSVASSSSSIHTPEALSRK